MSLELGAIIVTIASIVIVVLTNKFRSLIVRLILLASLTYGLSYTLYWYPVWFGATDDQYGSWAPIFINICFWMGLLGGFATLGVLQWLKSNNKEQVNS